MYVTSTILLHLFLPISRSLKEKRSIIQPLIHRLRKEFNISVSEVEKMDNLNEAVILCAHASNNKIFSRTYLNKVEYFIITKYKNIDLIESKIEIV